eukprot:IDg22878t1
MLFFSHPSPVPLFAAPETFHRGYCASVPHHVRARCPEEQLRAMHERSAKGKRNNRSKLSAEQRNRNGRRTREERPSSECKIKIFVASKGYGCYPPRSYGCRLSSRAGDCFCCCCSDSQQMMQAMRQTRNVLVLRWLVHTQQIPRIRRRDATDSQYVLAAHRSAYPVHHYSQLLYVTNQVEMTVVVDCACAQGLLLLLTFPTDGASG